MRVSVFMRLQKTFLTIHNDTHYESFLNHLSFPQVFHYNCLKISLKLHHLIRDVITICITYETSYNGSRYFKKFLVIEKIFSRRKIKAESEPKICRRYIFELYPKE